MWAGSIKRTGILDVLRSGATGNVTKICKDVNGGPVLQCPLYKKRVIRERCLLGGFEVPKFVISSQEIISIIKHFLYSDAMLERLPQYNGCFWQQPSSWYQNLQQAARYKPLSCLYQLVKAPPLLDAFCSFWLLLWFLVVHWMSSIPKTETVSITSCHRLLLKQAMGNVSVPGARQTPGSGRYKQI